MEKAKPIAIDADKLISRKAWRKTSVTLISLGGGLFCLSLVVGVFLYGFFAGAFRNLLTPGLGWVLIIVMGIGAVMFIGGVTSYFIAKSAYAAKKRNLTGPSKDVVIEALIHRLQNQDFGPDLAVITILGDLEDEKATFPLIQTLNQENPEVREKAAKALGNIKDQRAGEPLWSVLREAKEGKVKSAAGVALANLNWMPGTDAEKAYFFVWSKQWTEAEKLGAVAVDPLIESLKGADKWERMSAASTLGSIGDERALGPLNEALKDPADEVRSAVKTALKEINKKAKKKS